MKSSIYEVYIILCWEISNSWWSMLLLFIVEHTGVCYCSIFLFAHLCVFQELLKIPEEKMGLNFVFFSILDSHKLVFFMHFGFDEKKIAFIIAASAVWRT